MKVTSAAGEVTWLTAEGGRIRKEVRAGLRDEVVLRDQGICRYCGHDARPIDLDHVIPHSRGGADTVENLVVSCASCNRRKGNKTWTPKPVGWRSGQPRRPPKKRTYYRKNR